MATKNLEYALAQRAIQGDDIALNQLYNLDLTNFLESFVYKRTIKDDLSDEDRNDIIQLTLEATLQKLSRFNGESSFSTFVLGFANYIIKKYKSKEFKKSHRELPIEDNIIYIECSLLKDIGSDAYRSDPLLILIKKEKNERVKTALEQLSGDERDLLAMRFFSDNRVKDVAALLNTTEDAITSRMQRILKKLKVFLK